MRKVGHEGFIVAGLCLFIGLCSFKPSEPYLSEYLMCSESTQRVDCLDITNGPDCSESFPACSWIESTGQCQLQACDELTESQCGDKNVDYCHWDGANNSCKPNRCYKSFTEDQVNNDIYPWSTYAYFFFLLLLGPFAEVVSYRAAIGFGICGRLVTRLLLLFGTSLSEMQIMQVAYSAGTASEDVFSAYVYYMVPPKSYQWGTSVVKATALMSCVLSGVLGDLLVVEANSSLNLLMVLSAVFVGAGALVGPCVIRPIPSQEAKREASEIVSPQSLLLSDNSRAFAIDPPKKKWYEMMRTDMYALWKIVVAGRRSFQLLILFWLVGNAVYTILYNYEVSIYQELNQSSEWNGSVLGVMLAMGAAGALLPTLTPLGNADRDLAFVNFWLNIPIIFASICLVGGLVLYWETVPTLACLSAFFTCWQFVNMVFYTRLALELQLADTASAIEDPPKYNYFERIQSELDDNEIECDALTSVPTTPECETKESTSFTHTASKSIPIPACATSKGEVSSDPPFSMAVVAVVATCVALQVLLQAILFSDLQLPLATSCQRLTYMFVIASAVFCVAATAHHMKISAVFISHRVAERC